MKKMLITWDEVIKLIEDTYKIKDVKFMRRMGYEGDIEIYDEKSKESAEIQSLSSTSESGIKKMLKQQWDRNRQNTANDDSEN